MHNTNSPIVNNMMIAGNGGIYQPGYIPPNPINNIMPISSNGYNQPNQNMGGYYSGVYNNYFNPYMAAQQEQMRQAQLQEQYRMQSDILKGISKSVNRALGNEVDDEFLKRYDLQEQPQITPEEQEDMLTVRLINVHNTGYYGNPYNDRLIQANNAHYDQVKQEYPDDMSSLEYSERFSEIYIDVLKDREKSSQKNLGQLYDSNGYNQLIKMHSNNNNYFGSTFGQQGTNRSINIDDMEVKLPGHMNNEYQSRKQAFLNAILNK